MNSSEIPILPFANQAEFEKWMENNYQEEKGIWLKFYKKDSKIASINYKEALDVALCYGWIDGQANKYDEISWIQKFTPRRPRSIWSKRNIDHTERLIQSGKMKEPGLRAIESAKKDGRWEQAYDSPQNMTIPEYFLKELEKDPKAEAFFKNLNKSNLYAIGWRLQTAKKPETRVKRMRIILEKLHKEEKFHN